MTKKSWAHTALHCIFQIECCVLTHPVSLSINVQLHTLVSDEACYKVMEHYAGFVEQLAGSHLRAESRVGMEASYQKAVESLLGDENCFKLIFVSDF